MAGFAASEEVWATIQKLAASCRTKKGAVSYVTSDVLLKFGSGDLLVADASEDAIRGGRTSASVIQRAMGRGARVVSVDSLHAKVLLLGETACVGSANISLRSAYGLLEALVFSKQRTLVKEVSNWIDALAAGGQAIDATRLDALLKIEAKRPTIRNAFSALTDSHIVFFKEVVHGDIAKYEVRSSTAGSGGGARDLRISPASTFQPLLSRMFSETTNYKRASAGPVLSRTAANTVHETTVQLWDPTNARPNELRISRFYAVPGWEIDDDRFDQAVADGDKLFYVLEMDIHGTVTAKVLKYSELAAMSATIVAHIQRLSAQTGLRKSVVGAVDLVRNVAVPPI